MAEYHSSLVVGQTASHSGCSHTIPTFCDACLQAFAFPKCHVTSVTNNLVQLMDKTLSDALCDVPEGPEGTRQCTDSLHSVRMMIELWQTIVPRIHGKVIQMVPRVAALYRNDGLYLARFLRQMPLEYPIYKLESLRGLCGTFIVVAGELEESSQKDFARNVVRLAPWNFEILLIVDVGLPNGSNPRNFDPQRGSEQSEQDGEKTASPKWI